MDQTPSPATARYVRPGNPLPALIVVIPAHNEAQTVAGVVTQVRARLGCEVVVIDDASHDDTARCAEQAGATVLRLPLRLGAWGAAQTGLHYARRAKAQYVITMDADGQHHASAAAVLFEQREQHDADLVIGTWPQRLSPAKRLACAWFRLITRLDVHDFTSGLRIYGPRALRVVCSRAASLLEYQDIGVLILLHQQGLTIKEAQTPMSERAVGRSRVFSSWLTVARYMAQTTVLCLARLKYR